MRAYRAIKAAAGPAPHHQPVAEAPVATLIGPGQQPGDDAEEAHGDPPAAASATRRLAARHERLTQSRHAEISVTRMARAPRS